MLKTIQIIMEILTRAFTESLSSSVTIEMSYLRDKIGPNIVAAVETSVYRPKSSGVNNLVRIGEISNVMICAPTELQIRVVEDLKMLFCVKNLLRIFGILIFKYTITVTRSHLKNG